MMLPDIVRSPSRALVPAYDRRLVIRERDGQLERAFSSKGAFGGDYRRAIEALLNQRGDSCADLRTRQY